MMMTIIFYLLKKNKEQIVKSVKEKVDIIYKKTEEELKNNYKLLELVASMLLARNIVTLPEVIEQYSKISGLN